MPFSDMRFVKKFTPPDFQAKNFYFTEFNSFGDKTPKMSENRDIYTTAQ